MCNDSVQDTHGPGGRGQAASLLWTLLVRVLRACVRPTGHAPRMHPARRVHPSWYVPHVLARVLLAYALSLALIWTPV